MKADLAALQRELQAMWPEFVITHFDPTGGKPLKDDEAPGVFVREKVGGKDVLVAEITESAIRVNCSFSVTRLRFLEMAARHILARSTE